MKPECSIPHGRIPTIACTREKGHRGLHRWHLGPRWHVPARGGTCEARNKKHERCALPRDHWEAHRNNEGFQFTEAERLTAREARQ